jgi:hypothetical protein
MGKLLHLPTLLNFTKLTGFSDINWLRNQWLKQSSFPEGAFSLLQELISIEQMY